PPQDLTTYVLIGEHKAVIPADVVCDPATTTYGPTEWEMPCTTITSSVTVTARAWRDPLGHPHISFSPDLRFLPDDNNPVTLYLLDKAVANNPIYKIIYCN